MPKKLTRDPHPGVRLYDETLPSGRTRHIAKFVDPITRKRRTETLDNMKLRSPLARKKWAQQKSDWIASCRRALSLGLPLPDDPTEEPEEPDPQPEPPTLADGIELFLAAIADRRPRTVEGYRAVLKRSLPLFVAAGATSLDQITPALLAAVRQAIIGRPVSAASAASQITHVKAWLSRLRRLGHVALSSDQINDALERPRVDLERPDFLRPDACRALLNAAIEHDATMSAKARCRLSPFVAAALLSGCRLGELRAWRWSDVDFDAEHIRVDPTASKSRRDRLVDLSITPGLLQMLRTLHPGDDEAATLPYVWLGGRPVGEWAPGNWQTRLTQRGAPAGWSWQLLRQTASTYCAALVGPFRESQRHGHSIAISERHYLGLLRLGKDVATLDDAMGIADLVARIP